MWADLAGDVAAVFVALDEEAQAHADEINFRAWQYHVEMERLRAGYKAARMRAARAAAAAPLPKPKRGRRPANAVQPLQSAREVLSQGIAKRAAARSAKSKGKVSNG